MALVKCILTRVGSVGLLYMSVPWFFACFVGCFSGFRQLNSMFRVFDFFADILYPWRWNWKPRKRRKRGSMKTVTIYTDGACSGNPGPGGWGAILMYGPHKKELSGGEGHTTNNRMELTGVITALEALKEPCVAGQRVDQGGQKARPESRPVAAAAGAVRLSHSQFALGQRPCGEPLQ